VDLVIAMVAAEAVDTVIAMSTMTTNVGTVKVVEAVVVEVLDLPMGGGQRQVGHILLREVDQTPLALDDGSAHAVTSPPEQQQRKTQIPHDAEEIELAKPPPAGGPTTTPSQSQPSSTQTSTPPITNEYAPADQNNGIETSGGISTPTFTNISDSSTNTIPHNTKEVELAESPPSDSPTATPSQSPPSFTQTSTPASTNEYVPADQNNSIETGPGISTHTFTNISNSSTVTPTPRED